MAGLRPSISESGPIRDRLWAEIRRIKRFGVADLVALGVRRETVTHYLAGLMAAGILQKEKGQPAARGSFAPWVYVLVRDVGAETPRVRKDGSPVTQGLAREQLWRAIRILREFNAVELSVAASIPTVPVLLSEARFYLGKLCRAGYLHRIRPGVPGRLARYRLLPSRNTGPKPPMLQASGDVYDPNLNRVVWRRVPAQETADG